MYKQEYFNICLSNSIWLLDDIDDFYKFTASDYAFNKCLHMNNLRIDFCLTLLKLSLKKIVDYIAIKCKYHIAIKDRDYCV